MCVCVGVQIVCVQYVCAECGVQCVCAVCGGRYMEVERGRSGGVGGKQNV